MSATTPSETPNFSQIYRNAVDAQWRVTIPSDWRFEERAEFFIQRGEDHLLVLPKSEKDRFLRWADTLPGTEREEAMEAWAESSMRVKIDSAGRVTLPSDWAKAVGLDVKKTAVLAGAMTTFKVWAEARYDEVAALRAAKHASALSRFKNATVSPIG